MHAAAGLAVALCLYTCRLEEMSAAAKGLLSLQRSSACWQRILERAVCSAWHAVSACCCEPVHSAVSLLFPQRSVGLACAFWPHLTLALAALHLHIHCCTRLHAKRQSALCRWVASWLQQVQGGQPTSSTLVFQQAASSCCRAAAAAICPPACAACLAACSGWLQARAAAG